MRFIAANDGVDSEREDNDFTPLRNTINEWYEQDTSKKIRAVFRAKGMSGKRLSTQALYGYLWDSEGNLTTDPETASVVKLIFQLTAEGNGPGKIARRLRDFLSGVAYANEGKIKKVAISTYIITPYNVDILGDLIDELENNGLYF